MAEKKVTLRSSDGESFEVDKAVAVQMRVISPIIQHDSSTVIPLPNVNSEILAKVIEYCKKHVNVDYYNMELKALNELKTWDADFVNVEQPILFDLILAANYLSVKSLLTLTLQTVAGMLKGKNAEEIRTTFNIENDFPPEEE